MTLQRLLETTDSALERLLSDIAGHQAQLDSRGLSTARFQELVQAHATLKQGIAAPHVRLAVTGTTSSGKSSLLNFLCGDALLPTGAQEKSAGLVRIIHAEEIRLEIVQTPGASWECGIWEGLSAADIEARLSEVMDSFLKARNAGEEMQPPVATVHYPTLLGRQIGAAQAGLEMLDLPGLRAVSDASLTELVRECRDALCLVTFSAEDTDPERRRKAMQQVLDEVRALGGNRQRLLFVATRVDAFLRDARNWPASEENFLQTCLDELQEVLPDIFGPDRETAPSLLRLSPLPALWTQQLADEGRRMAAWNSIRKSFLFLVESGAERTADRGIDIDSDLSDPRAALWNEADWQTVRRQLEDTTGAQAFLHALTGHIREQIPQIALHPLLVAFLQAVQTYRGVLQRACDFQLQRIRDKDADIALWQERQSVLDGVLPAFLAQRTAMQTALADISCAMRSLAGEKSLAPALNALAEALPAGHWQEAPQLMQFDGLHRDVRRLCLQPMRSICNSLLTITPDIAERQLASLHQGTQLAESCKTLIQLGYAGHLARDGWTIEKEILEERHMINARIRHELARLLNLLYESLHEATAAFQLAVDARLISLFNAMLRHWAAQLAAALKDVGEILCLQPQNLPHILSSLAAPPRSPAPPQLPPLTCESLRVWQTALVNNADARETVQIPLQSGRIPSCHELNGLHEKSFYPFMDALLLDVSARLDNYAGQYCSIISSQLATIGRSMKDHIETALDRCRAEREQFKTIAFLLQQARNAGQEPLAELEALSSKLVSA